MSVHRITTALSMTGREFLRRRGMLALMVGVPVFGFVVIFLALPDSPAALEAVENDVTVRIALTQPELFGGLSALSYVGMLAAITGLYLLRSAMAADRRLMVAGYTSFDLAAARILFLSAVNGALTAFMVGLMLVFFIPRDPPLSPWRCSCRLWSTVSMAGSSACWSRVNSGVSLRWCF